MICPTAAHLRRRSRNCKRYGWAAATPQDVEGHGQGKAMVSTTLAPEGIQGCVGRDIVIEG